MKFQILLFTAIFSIMFLAVHTNVYAATQEFSNNSLTNPDVAEAVNAGDVVRIFGFLHGLGEPMEVALPTWILSAGISGAQGAVTSTACSGNFGDEEYMAQMNQTEGAAKCFDVSNEAFGRYGEYGRTPGGLGNLLVSSMSYMVEDPIVPTDMAYFMRDTFGDTLLGESVYADDGMFPEPIKNLTFVFWKAARNIAVSFLVIILGITGIMIMLQHKISPQVVATVYNTLPNAAIGIGFILLSYAIVTMALASIPFLTQIAVAIGNKAASEVSVDASNFTGLLVEAGNGVIEMQSATSLVLVFVSLVLLVFFIVVLIVFTIKVISIYIGFIWYVISAPFVGLIYMIPGQQGILIGFLRKLLADILTIPLMLLAVMMGLIVIVVPYADPSASSLGSFALTFGFRFVWNILAAIIGLTIIAKSVKIHKMLKEALQVEKGIFYNPKPKR